MKKILQSEQKTLRRVAREVPLADIKTPKIRKIIAEMSAALASQDDGVALAAPQIGYSLRIFLISGKVLRKAQLRGRGVSPAGAKALADKQDENASDLVFINPKIIKLSREKAWTPEGCLSLRWLYGKTLRAKKAIVEAHDEHGLKFTRGGSGLIAQIFQHETDHLEGILFTDHAKEVIEELPQQHG